MSSHSAYPYAANNFPVLFHQNTVSFLLATDAQALFLCLEIVLFVYAIHRDSEKHAFLHIDRRYCGEV